jgi:raffinose/stachyose/melibiose transport system permease protein
LTRYSISRRRRILVYLVFVTPALVFFTLFFVYPVFGTFVLSVFKWNAVKPKVFVGLSNFLFIIRNGEKVVIAFFNTFFIAIVTTLILNIAALFLAMMLVTDRTLSQLYKVFLFTPVVISRVASAIIFALLLDPTRGFVNIVLKAIGLGSLAIPWLGRPIISLLVIAAIIVWGGIGVTMTIFIAGLKSIPLELQEAAEIDGVGRATKMRHITLPLLAPAITVNVVLVFISCLKVFDEPWLIYHQTPPKISSSVSTIIVWEAFSGSQFGLSAAIAVLLFLVTMLLGFFLLFMLRSRERQMR